MFVLKDIFSRVFNGWRTAIAGGAGFTVSFLEPVQSALVEVGNGLAAAAQEKGGVGALLGVVIYRIIRNYIENRPTSAKPKGK